jgi:butyrate kinase
MNQKQMHTLLNIPERTLRGWKYDGRLLMIPSRFKAAIIDMMHQIAKAIPDSHRQMPVKAYLTGGGAAHNCCNSRVSDDIDLIMPFAVSDTKVDKEHLRQLAEGAINVGVGFQKKFVKTNLAQVLEMFETS